MALVGKSPNKRAHAGDELTMRLCKRRHHFRRGVTGISRSCGQTKGGKNTCIKVLPICWWAGLVEALRRGSDAGAEHTRTAITPQTRTADWRSEAALSVCQPQPFLALSHWAVLFRGLARQGPRSIIHYPTSMQKCGKDTVSDYS